MNRRRSFAFLPARFRAGLARRGRKIDWQLQTPLPLPPTRFERRTHLLPPLPTLVELSQASRLVVSALRPGPVSIDRRVHATPDQVRPETKHCSVSDREVSTSMQTLAVLGTGCDELVVDVEAAICNFW